MMKKKRNIALYVRISKVPAKSQYSLQQQIEQLEAALPADLERDRINVYAEVGSGNLGVRTDLNGRVRGEYRRLVEDICRGKVECVYVADPSRLSRNVIGLYAFTETCRERNVKIIAGNKEFGTKDLGIGESTIALAKSFGAVIRAMRRESRRAPRSAGRCGVTRCVPGQPDRLDGRPGVMGMGSIEEALAALKPELDKMDPDLLLRENYGPAKSNDRPLSAKELGALSARLETGGQERVFRGATSFRGLP